MELRQLRYLVALAEEGSFTRAAAKSLVAQPALSQQIAKLEGELGVALADRTTRHVSLTEAGRVLVEHARRALAEMDVARAEIDGLVGLRSGRLTIGASQTVGSLDLAQLVSKFHRRHPNVELSVREDLSGALVPALKDDALDMAFITSPPGGIGEGLEMRPVAREKLVAVVPPGHQLAKRRRIELGLLRDEPLVTFRRGATIRARLDATAAANGFEPRVAFETTDVPRMKALVAAGLAIAVLPRSDAERPGPRVTVVALTDRELVHEVSLAWRRGRHLSPAARRFIEMALASAS
jgi:DNA-binding transcriptional LysR family regulator